jgi:putative ABC transport system permease protein
MHMAESLRIAIRALAANKLRSILTMLGTIIGVAAVLTLMSVGQGVEQYVTAQFAGIGTNLLFIVPGQLADGPPAQRVPGSSTLTLSDANAIAGPNRIAGVAAIAPEIIGQADVTRGRRSLSLQVSGTTPDYAVTRSWAPSMGSFISASDVDNRARVVVLGATAYARLFDPGEYPIDQTIQINDLIFRVIGVMEEKGGSGFGNLDELVFLPFTAAQDRLFRRRTTSGDYRVSVIYVSVETAEAMSQVQEEITLLLRERHDISYLNEDDFSVINQADLISIFGDILGALTLFLGAIAGISLLVGGIGIMNIMLVSVTERTREIGLRKAVGARRRDILGQFLLEAVTLSFTGGLLGIAIGIAGAQAISRLQEGFAAVVTLDVVLIAILFSLAVGLFFGIYPAHRASRLNPIDALRYE